MGYNDELHCPYCGAQQEVEFDGNGSGLQQCDCGDCEKRFVYEVDWSPRYSARKADCLNGGEHDYEDRLEGDEYYRDYFSKWLRCRRCEHQIRESKEKAA